jgi:hypothetical protein
MHPEVSTMKPTILISTLAALVSLGGSTSWAGQGRGGYPVYGGNGYPPTGYQTVPYGPGYGGYQSLRPSLRGRDNAALQYPNFYLPGASDGYGGSVYAPDLRDAYPPAPRPYPTGYSVPTTGNIPALADLLAGQAEEFLAFFRTQRGIVPEWNRFMDDAGDLRNAAVGFRDAAAQGANLATLRGKFRLIANRWQRLEGRMARVNKGRVGPNIAKALEMGQTVDQLAQLLP